MMNRQYDNEEQEGKKDQVKGRVIAGRGRLDEEGKGR
jgi:hypothetical protein